MAKCAVCNSRKGKRKCPATEGVVCSLCCGTIRTPEKCGDCSILAAALQVRNYSHIPYYEINRMDQSADLQDIAIIVEKNLVDIANVNDLSDSQAKAIIERLLDHYHFGDTALVFSSAAEEQAFQGITRQLSKKSSSTSAEIIVKVLCTVLRSLRRRTEGGREYINFIKRFFS